MKTFSIAVIFTLVLAAGLLPVSTDAAFYGFVSGDGYWGWACQETIPISFDVPTRAFSTSYTSTSSVSVGLSPAKRSTETMMDIIAMGEERKKYMEDNFSLDGLFRAVDTDCDGYLDSCEWNKLDSTGVRDFMDVLGRVNSTDDLLSLEEVKQLDYPVEVSVLMLMPMDGVKMMMGEMAGQDEDNDGDDDGPKDRKRPDGDNP